MNGANKLMKIRNQSNKTLEHLLKKTMKPEIKSFVSENQQDLLKEASKAMEKGVWDQEANDFVRRLISHGSLQKAKGNGKIPHPNDNDVEHPTDGFDSEGKPSREEEMGACLDMAEAIRYAARCSRETQETESFKVHWGELEFDNHDEQYIEKQLKTNSSKIDLIIVLWKRTGRKKEYCRNFMKGHEMNRIDSFFFGEDMQALQISLKARLTPLISTKETYGSLAIEKTDTALVETEPEDADGFFRTDQRQRDKSFVIVVAGESGSGKSVFACQQALDSDFTTLYKVLDKSDYDKVQPKPTADFPALNALLQAAINNADSLDQKALFALKKQVNLSRNGWAKALFESAIETIKQETRSAQEESWLSGNWKSRNRPAKVAIIIDEATDVDLVEGLVSMGRIIISQYSNLAKEGGKVQLVLAGVGLDAIRVPGRVGTDPDLSRLVTMVGPMWTRLEEKKIINPSVKNSLEKGIFARVLKTNTRMFFRSVLPILTLYFHGEDSKHMEHEKKRSRYEKRLKEIGSFRPMMDHAPRYYVNQNTVKNLEMHGLLLQSFAVHLAISMKSLNLADESLKKNLQRELDEVLGFDGYEEFVKNPESNIYARGLASRRGTSGALKYLACFGLTCTLRPSFEDEFEEMTALHFMRYMEAQGYQPLRFSLLHAWPPKRSRGNIDDQIEKLNETLQEQEKRELGHLQSQHEIPESGKWCFVFSQGTASAQGGDVLALLVDMSAKKGKLESIQCKHFARKPTEEAKCYEWWASLGVHYQEGGMVNVSPTSGSAGYSFKGLKSLRDLLSEWLKVEVELGKRTLAMSFRTPSSFPVPDDNSCRAWFREMFEPTISVLQTPESPAVEQLDE